MFDVMVLYSGNAGADFISMILAIITISFYCFGLVNDSDQSNKKRTKKRTNTNELPKRLHGTYVYQTNYDPRWDDAYFEKRGREPWFDDNPWDHHKK